MRTQLLNNTEGPIYAQMPHAGRDKAGVIQLGEVLIIVPGLNFIDSKKLATLRENKGFETLFTERLKPSKSPERNPANFGRPHLEVIGKEVPDEYPLLKQSDAACDAMISQVQSTDLLAEWLKMEARPEIRKQIEERAKFLTSGITAGGAAAVTGG